MRSCILSRIKRVFTGLVSIDNEERPHAETGEISLKRWEAALRAGNGYLRPLDPSLNLDLVFSLHYQHVVKKDGSFSFRGKEYKLRQCAGREVTVCLIPKKKILVAWEGKKVGDFPL
jgi:hypothetical protein